MFIKLFPYRVTDINITIINGYDLFRLIFYCKYLAAPKSAVRKGLTPIPAPAARASPSPASPLHLVRHAVPASQLQAVAAEVDSSDGFEHTAGAEQANAVDLEEVRHLYDSPAFV